MAYRWGDGKGKVHSISLGQHKKNVRKQRSARKKQAAARANDPAAPRSMRDIGRDASRATQLRYGAEESALGLRARQAPAWFGEYQAKLTGTAQGIQQGYQKAIADIGAQAQQAAASDTTARNSLATTMQADAQKFGGQADPSLFKDDVNAANVRNTNQAAFQGLLTAQQGAQGNYFGGLSAAGAAAQLGAQTQIGNDQRALAADKGLYRSQYVSEGRDAERKYGLERQAFGLDVAKAKADVSGDAADRRSESRKERNTVVTSGPFAGLTNGQIRGLSPKKKNQLRRKAKGPESVLSEGAFAGYTQSQIRALSPAQRQKLVKKYKAGGDTDKKKAAGERISDIVGRWNHERTKKYDFGTDDKPDVRAPSASEIKDKLLKEGFTMPEIQRAIARIKRQRKRNPAKPKNRPAPKTVLNPFD